MQTGRTQKTGSFKEDIRRALVSHAITPVLLVTLVCFVVIFIFWHITVEKETRAYNEALSNDISQTLEVCITALDEMSGQYRVDALEADASKRAQAYREIYSRMMDCPIPADFYIVDGDMRSIVSSNKASTYYPHSVRAGGWGVARLMDASPDIPIWFYDMLITDNIVSSTELTIGRALEGGGYLLFLLRGSDFFSGMTNRPSLAVVVNEYGRVLTATSDRLIDNNGYAPYALRGESGYFSLAGDSYYSICNLLMGGRLAVYTMTQVTEVVNAAGLMIIMLALVFFSLTVLIFRSAKRVATQKTATIDELLVSFEEAGRGNLDYRLSITSNDEFQIIGDSYNKMLERMKELIALNKEQATETVISEIRQLESQFNPHFIYNTLETIRYTIVLKPKAADKMIVWLAELLRYSVSDASAEVTLGEDSAYTHNYLRIQKTRFGHAFDFKLDIPPETTQCLVPKLFLQPVIENSIKHGFEQTGKLSVEVTARIQDDDLLLVISDNGAGIQPDKLRELRASLEQKRRGAAGIGLYNIHRRIYLLHGAPYGLTLESEAGRGTTVRILLPVRFRQTGLRQAQGKETKRYAQGADS